MTHVLDPDSVRDGCPAGTVLLIAFHTARSPFRSVSISSKEMDPNPVNWTIPENPVGPEAEVTTGLAVAGMLVKLRMSPGLAGGVGSPP
ncbi:hypothetical protein AYO38_04165 [bacterium SCGC AG-212-C10]|nr:hypothetical protein AYO38_04165 [bacterium SCGC AG-212-C10]